VKKLQIFRDEEIKTIGGDDRAKSAGKYPVREMKKFESLCCK